MPVKLGLENLLEERLDRIAGRRVSVIANPSSVDSGLRHIVDLFHSHPEIQLVSVMGPQHGVRGETQDNMIEWTGFRDPATGLPMHSLYGQTRKPTPQMLADADVVVFDVQDVGARYYTFIHTMALAMEACSELEKEFVVLDRPNPINGVDLEGPVLDPAFSSFVGLHPIPIRHGLTVGEMARFLNSEGGIGCALEVIPMSGWRREQFYDETGLPWVPPSPNMPTLDTATVYPGMCLLEGTNVSEGRGTTRPFEISGAPWANPARTAARLESANLPGARFRPLHFIPTFHKWADRIIGGVQIHVTDRRGFRPVRTALAIIQAYREQEGSHFSWNPPPYEYETEKLPIDILFGSDQPRVALEAGAAISDLERSWGEALDDFNNRRRDYLLY